MTNKQIFQKLSDLKSEVAITKLFWIALSIEENSLQELLEEMSEEDYKECFPEVYESKYFKAYMKDRNRMIEVLLDYDTLGFLAELNLATISNIRFDDGEPISWSIHKGILDIQYVYAETTEELFYKIKVISEKHFERSVQEYKDKNTIS